MYLIYSFSDLLIVVALFVALDMEPILKEGVGNFNCGFSIAVLSASPLMMVFESEMQDVDDLDLTSLASSDCAE